MIKLGGARVVEVLLDLFNEVLSSRSPPQKWKESVISVIHKSGDERLPKNYRPITIIPVLYKLFARLLYRRLLPILDKAQCEDQAGFRKGYNTADHLLTFSILAEKSRSIRSNTTASGKH
eukprot:6990483-Karenia_brevis.AAC.1